MSSSKERLQNVCNCSHSNRHKLANIQCNTICRNRKKKKQQLINLTNVLTSHSYVLPNTCEEDEIYSIECCDGILEDCKCLNRLKRVMVNYVYHYFDIDCIDIQLILNDFLHLMHKHNSRKEFEIIAGSFEYCDIRNCYIFSRHYRHRKNPNKKSNKLILEHNIHNGNIDNNMHEIVSMQILDTIHCYYNHTFDIGFRTRYNRIIPNKHDNKHINYEKKIDKITSEKHDLYHKVVNNCNDEKNNSVPKSVNKFVDNIETNNTETMKPKITKQTPARTLMYSYGIRFLYGFDDEYTWKKANIDCIRYVPKKYDGFKQEIASLSKVADIGINQWAHQYKKAQLHFNSFYCKAFVTRCNKMYNEALDGAVKYELKIEHLLALMFYCNYDKLQYKFSKTYRRKTPFETNQQIAKRHSNFYHLGQYIVQAVHYFGSRINDNNEIFYHGVSQQTVFSSASYAYFNGPLSTSSDYSVAACFANQNGLIVELSDTNSVYSSAKYFAMHWLSCYSNEQECLFIACDAPLLFRDIVSVSSGTEYKSIIKSLHLFNHIFKGMKLQHTLCYTESQIAYKCIGEQLKGKGLNYSSFDSLDSYAKKLINKYFDSQKELWIDLNVIKNKIKWVNELFCDNINEWIDLKLINILFPNVECIYFRWRIQLNTYILDNILMHLRTEKYNQLRNIRIAIDKKNSEIDIESAIDEFSQQFEPLEFVIYDRAGTDLCIEKCNVYNHDYI